MALSCPALIISVRNPLRDTGDLKQHSFKDHGFLHGLLIKHRTAEATKWSIHNPEATGE